MYDNIRDSVKLQKIGNMAGGGAEKGVLTQDWVAGSFDNKSGSQRHSNWLAGTPGRMSLRIGPREPIHEGKSRNGIADSTSCSKIPSPTHTTRGGDIVRQNISVNSVELSCQTRGRRNVITRPTIPRGISACTCAYSAKCHTIDQAGWKHITSPKFTNENLRTPQLC
jgi:hypothetical protein